MKSFFGKYRGKVIDNADPGGLGRLKISVPAMPGALGWAMPCTPYAGPGVGFFAMPPIGASVWVEFEGGNPAYPIWTGCFWEAAEDVPAEPSGPDQKVLVMEGIRLCMSTLDGQKGFTLQVGDPLTERSLKLVMDGEGITLDNQGKTMLTLTETAITLSNRDRSIATLTEEDIKLENGQLSITMASGRQTITTTNGVATTTASPSSLTHTIAGTRQVLTAGSAKTTNAAATLEVTSTAIKQIAAASSAEISVAGISLESGAASVAIGPAIVNVNHGALEVI